MNADTADLVRTALTELVARAQDGQILESDLLDVLDQLDLPAAAYGQLIENVKERGLELSTEMDEDNQEDPAVTHYPERNSNVDGFGRFMTQARHRILAADEEFALGVRIDSGHLASEALSTATLLSADARAELQQQVEHGLGAQRELALHNIRLVVSIARRYRATSLDLDDLVQEGCLGLFTAASKFDPYRRLKFSTYATWWIRQAVQRAIANLDRPIRLPVHIVEEISRLASMRTSLEIRLGRQPTFRELASSLGIDESRIFDLHRWSAGMASLDADVGEGGTTLKELISVAGPDPARVIFRLLKREAINELLDDLGDREREVLEMRYGLKDGRPRTLEEIGRAFRVTRERIRQIEVRCLARLRTPMNIRKLESYEGD